MQIEGTGIVRKENDRGSFFIVLEPPNTFVEVGSQLDTSKAN